MRSLLEFLGVGFMAKTKADLLKGTLDLLILKALRRKSPMHGYGISVMIRQWSDDVLTVEQGSLYPALYRLEERGYIDFEWGVSENNRKGKFYRLTSRGEAFLDNELANWTSMSRAINMVLQIS